MIKINFHGGKNQFSSTVTPANFCTGYACTGNTLVWLAGIPGKTFVRCPATRLYRECQPIKRECYLCTRFKPHQPIRHARNFLGTAARQTSFTANASQSNERVTCPRVAGTEVCGCYRGRNWFLPPWKLIFTAGEFFLFFIFYIYSFPLEIFLAL